MAWGWALGYWKIQLGNFCSLADTLIGLRLEHLLPHLVPRPNYTISITISKSQARINLLYLQIQTRTKPSPEQSAIGIPRPTLSDPECTQILSFSPPSQPHPTPSSQVKPWISTLQPSLCSLSFSTNTYPYPTSFIQNIFTMAPKKFPRFNKLPLEIRRRIWNLSHAPRVIRAKCENATIPNDHRTIW